MKKLFLIPLMAMLCTVMAWGTTYQVGNYADLKAALQAGDATLIELTDDITYDGAWSTFNSDDLYDANAVLTGLEDALCITNSLTLDGKGHEIIGFGKHNVSVTAANNNHRVSIAIHPESANAGLQVTIQNLKLGNHSKNKRYYGIISFDGVSNLTLKNDSIICEKYSYQQPVCFTGANETALQLTIKESYLDAGLSAYPAYVLKPVNATLENNTFVGYCALYFKYRATGVYGDVSGARGSVVNADACAFNGLNIHSGESNAFAVFPMEDDGITLNLHNCSFNAEQIGDQYQAWVSVQYRTRANANQPIVIKIFGDNTHMYNINASKIIDITDNWKNSSNKLAAETGLTTSLTIEGGTFSLSPDAFAIEQGDGTINTPTIASGFVIDTVKQGTATLYRVVKKAATYVDPVTSEETLYDLNADVPTDVAGEGINPATSFELSTGGTMELDENREVTTAGYVQVKDNEDTGNATVVKVGTTSTSDPTQKVDQTLIINNGLSVEGNSQVVVETGSNLIIGEGGITTEDPANIVIETSEEKSGSLLLDPTITVNQNPNLTVKMVTKVGYEAPDYYWHRFALPVMGISTWEKLDSNGDPLPTATTYIYSWDYNNNDWQNVSSLSEMQPFYGYNMTHVLPKGTEVTYVFKGNLVGNVNMPLNFTMEGYNFFGNSYTAYIETLTMIEAIAGSNEVAGTVWVWGNDANDLVTYQQYVPTSIYQLRRGGSGLAAWQKEIAPMQTFILQLRQGDPANVEGAVIDYTSAIWNNPRYNTAAMAPVRATVNEDANVRISVIASNGKGDRVDFTENVNYSDGYENDADATKYMNNNRVNLYSTINDENYSVVVTDNISGKTLSLQTTNDVNYTMLFSNVEGTQYAIRDLMTNVVTPMTEGNSYTFAAQPNTTIEGRFVIVPMQNMPTDVETVETTTAVKGIYTIMGQYVGEDFESLPAGVYVVDGVKIVK